MRKFNMSLYISKKRGVKEPLKMKICCGNGLKSTVTFLSLDAGTERSVIITLKIDIKDALILSLSQAPLIHLINPMPVKDMITDKLIAMIESYVNQTINKKEYINEE